jgi:hypothetical protein
MTSGSAEPESASSADSALTSLTRTRGSARANVVFRLQRTQGNAYVQRLLARGAAVGDGGGQSAFAQRQSPPTTDAPPAAEASLTLGPFVIKTYDQLLAAERLLSQQLTKDSDGLPDGEPAKQRAQQAVKGAQAWEGFLSSQGSQPLSQASVNQANLWYQEFVQCRKDIGTFLAVQARQADERIAADSLAADQKLQAALQAQGDVQRAAFLKKDNDLLEKIQGVAAKAALASSALIELHERANAMTGLYQTLAEQHSDEIMEKFARIAEPAHKVIASLEILQNSLKALHPEGATELDEQMNKATASLDAGVAAISLIPMCAAYTIYVSALVSVLEGVMVWVTNYVREQGHQINLIHFSDGKLDEVDWSVEPGGRPTYDFMARVMKAGSWVDIPKDIPPEVDKFVVGSREQLEAGSGDEVPTTGFWFWRHTDKDKIREWVFTNRGNVWRMLYGSLTPPS